MRGYWKKAKAVKQWRELTWYGAAAARVLASEPTMRQIPDCRVHPVKRSVTITVYRARLLDWDNLVASVKGCVDGLRGQLIADDGPAWLQLQVHQEKVAHRKDERVQFEVGEATA